MADSVDSPADTDPVPPFDPAAALQLLGGRWHVLLELTQLFLRNREGLVQSVENGVTSGDAVQLAREIHGVRGAIEYFRASPLLDLTRQMQEAAEREELNAIRQAIPEFRTRIGELARALEAFVAADSSTT